MLESSYSYWQYFLDTERKTADADSLDDEEMIWLFGL